MKILITFKCPDETMYRIVEASHSGVVISALMSEIGENKNIEVQAIRECGSVLGVVDLAKWLKEKKEI